MARVTLTNVVKTYPNGHRAVRDVSLDIADGEFVVLVGPSGCGKSTTLRLIAGLEEDFSGTIRIGERVVNDVEPKDRDVAMVFQNYALYPHMSVYKNMALALELRGVGREQVRLRVDAAAKLLGIEGVLDRKPAQLSGGQRQRVALGRAIVREPAAFLFDEPLSNLDAKLRVATRAELKALHQRLRTTSVYVTHDQEEAMTLGDRIVVMAQGQVQQAAAPMEVYRRPVNRFVASFVGTPPMNFFEGTLTRDEHGLCVAQRSGTALPLASVLGDRLAPMMGQPVVAGVRPSGLTLGPGEGARGLDADVRTIELLGEQVDLHALVPGGEAMIARLPAGEAASALRPAQRVRLFVRPADVMLFEPGEFGRNLVIDA